MAGNKFLVLVATVAAVFGICSAATYTVGDSSGWTIPSPSSLYTTWASKQKFQVGDTLVFKFPAGTHTVAEVSKSAYDSCSTGNPISAVMTTAPANITIKSAGTHYYICTITGHCAAGQKLAVVATGSSTAAAPKSTKKASSPAPAPSSTAAAPATTAAATPTGAPSVLPTTPGAGAPASTTAVPPSGNFAATNVAGVGFVGLISVAVAALVL